MDMYKKCEGFNFKFNTFKCLECDGKCCSGDSGYIWVSEEEIRKIAEFLDIELSEFNKLYIRKAFNKKTLAEIKIKGDYICVFFDIEKKRCTIYNARPKQCRDYPFWDYYKGKTDLLKKEYPVIEDL